MMRTARKVGYQFTEMGDATQSIGKTIIMDLLMVDLIMVQEFTFMILLPFLQLLILHFLLTQRVLLESRQVA